ncbi:MAG: Crp/Fnr family transcriptional regulator [Oscillibacter sp.]|jgi:CRP/FNR family cyclic AMP-dependent transcriptional regulator|nr:Crp/Fnr family transcriptional regulator [Oscillibacter sp.]
MENMFIQRRTYETYRENLLREFSGLGTPVHCRKREVVELSGSTADFVYLIRSGCIRQYFGTPAGETMILLLLSPGDLFNEVTLLNGNGNCVVSMAHTDAELLRIPSKLFREKLEREPSLYQYISYQIAYKLRVTMALLYDLSFSSTQERLRSLLLRLCVQMGRDVEGGIRLPYYFTHEEYAQMISASRSTVSRLIKYFAEAGYLRMDGRCVVVCPELQEADLF